MRKDINEYFMDIAEKVSTRSTCVKRQVGAIIVKDKMIVSTGYNNPSKGLPNCDESECMLDESGKCLKAVHAEVNAIMQASPEERKDAIMYVTCQPCDKCQLAILNSGIKLVIYKEKHTPKIDWTNNMCISLEEAMKKDIVAQVCEELK